MSGRDRQPQPPESSERGGRLYKDLADWGGRTRYTTINTDLIPMIGAYHRGLSRLSVLLLLHICVCYDNAAESNLQPLPMSYGELAEKYRVDFSSVRQALRQLADERLIIVSNAGERAGRSKYAYAPDVERIQSELKKYLEDEGRLS